MRADNKNTIKSEKSAPPQPKSAGTPKTNPIPARTRAVLKGLDQADLSPDMRSAVMRLIGEVDRLNDQAGSLQTRIAELESLADTDPLLPVYNRRAFTRELKRAMAMAKRHGLAGALVLIDLDDFKTINDTFGHPAGDAVLHAVSRSLNEHVRETDIVGRLGGDEFGVLLAAADEEGAAAKAASLVEMIREQDFVLDGQPMRIGASAGVQCFDPAFSANALIKRADDALYACKKSKGRAA
jgi:diguanylate cyclase (GGDEF)-like protein